MALLKTLLGSLLFGVRDMLILVFILLVCFGLLALILGSPWGLGITLFIVMLLCGHDSYKQRTKS